MKIFLVMQEGNNYGSWHVKALTNDLTNALSIAKELEDIDGDLKFPTRVYKTVLLNNSIDAVFIFDNPRKETINGIEVFNFFHG